MKLDTRSVSVVNEITVRGTSKSLLDFTPFFLARFSSPETRRSYQTTLNEFFACIQNQGMCAQEDMQISEITEDNVFPYVQLLEEKHRLAGAAANRRAQTTIARKLSTLRSFFTLAQKKGLIDSNPFENVPLPKVPRRSKTQALTPLETKKIIQEIEHLFARAKSGSRSQKAAELAYAVTLVLLTTGLRVSELCSIRMADFVGNELHILRKGGLTQKIFLHPLTVSVMASYKEKYRFHASAQEYFFVRTQVCQTSTRLSPKAVWLMVTKAAKLSGIEVLPSPHTFRATLATELHRQGVLLHRIQDLLGHSNVSTTALYIKKLSSVEDSPSVKLRVLKSKI